MNNKLRFCTFTLSRRNRPFRTTALLLFFVLSLLFSAVGIVRTHQQKLIMSRSNIYGYFDSIVYQNADEIQTDLPEEIAKVRVSAILTDKNTPERTLRVGTYTPAAKAMIFRGNDDISLPSGELDCGLRRSLAEKLGKGVGDVLEVCGHRLTVRRLFPDLGFLWIKGEREEKQQMTLPDLWISERAYDHFFSGEASKYQLLLLDIKQYNSLELFSPKGNIYRNTTLVEDENLQSYRFPSSFYRAQLLALLAISLLLLRAYSHFSRPRYAIYEDLGLCRSTLRAVIRREYLLLSLPSLVLAWGVGALANYAFVLVIYRDASYFHLFRYSEYALSSVLIYLAALLFCLVNAGLDFAAFRLLFLRRQKQHLPLRSLKTASLSLLLLSLLIYICVSLFCSLQSVRSQNQTLEFFGQISKTCDFELHFNERGFPPDQYIFGDALVDTSERKVEEKIEFNSENHLRKLDQLLPEIEKIKGVARVDKFRENYFCQLPIPEDLLSSTWLFTLQGGAIFNFTEGPFTKKYIRQNERPLSDCSLFALPDNYLADLARRLALSAEKQAALLRGESAILIAPSVRITRVVKDVHGEGYFWERSSDGPDLLKDPHLAEYKKIALYLPQSEQYLKGFVPQDDLLRLNASFRRLEIPIAAASYENLAWFSICEHVATPYRVIVGDAFLQKAQVTPEISRLHIFLDEGADVAKISRTLQSSVQNIPDLQFTDQHYNVEAWHEFEKMESLIIALYTLLFIILLLSFTFSVSYLFYLENERKFILYRDLGMTQGMLLRSCFLRLLPSVALTVLLQLLLGLFFFGKHFDGWTSSTLLPKILLPALCIGLYFLLFFLFLLAQCRKMMRRQTYSE